MKIGTSTFRRVKVRDIKAAVYNPRVDLMPGDPDYEAIKRSLDEFGLVDPLIWNEVTGNLVGGHQRLNVLTREFGLNLDSELEVSVVHIPEDHREKALNIALNKDAGRWDMPRLRDILSGFVDIGFDTAIAGFDEFELDSVLGGMVLPGMKSSEDGSFLTDGTLSSAPKSDATMSAQIDPLDLAAAGTPVTCPECGHGFVV
jgi:hypothetical protein